MILNHLQIESLEEKSKRISKLSDYLESNKKKDSPIVMPGEAIENMKEFKKR